MRRQWVVLGVLAALIVVGAVVSGPSSGDDRGPQGTLALRRYLGAMGLTVRDADTPPPAPGVFVLLKDLRLPPQAADVVAWAREGGTLVVADPNAESATAAGVGPSGRVGRVGFGPATLAPGCVTAEVAGVRTLAVDGADSVLGSDPGGVGCFPASGGRFEVTTPVGSGKVIVLGGISPLTNALLGKADNAAFALGIFGGGGPVVFGAAMPPGGPAPKGLVGSLPSGARVVLFQILVAMVVFAFVRGRRFGRPLSDNIPSPVPSGELVHAVARLYRSSQARTTAGDALRRGTRRRLRARLGLGPEPAVTAPGPDDALSSTVAQLSGLAADRVQQSLFGAAPISEEGLIALGRELEELRQRVEGSWI